MGDPHGLSCQWAMLDDRLTADGQLLFHIALRSAALSQGLERAVTDIARNGTADAANAALAMAGNDLAAHPDDKVLSRALLVLGESKRRLATELS